MRCKAHHSRAQGEQDSNQEGAANLGHRIGLFVEWADNIETEGGTLEEQRLEYRELLGDLAIYEEELNGAELECYSDLTTIVWWEHDETEEAERELRILRDGTRRLILNLLHMQNTAPPKRVRQIKRPPRRKADEWLGQPPPTLHQVRSHLGR